MKYDNDDLEFDTLQEQEEIADYYSNLDDDLSLTEEDEDILPAAESEPIQEKKQPEPQKETAADETSDETAEEKNPNITFFIITGAISAVVLALFFFLGSMSHKYEEDINFELAKQREKNSSYAEVKKETEDNQNAISELTSENEELQKELNTITDYESDTGEIKSNINVLKDKLDDINKEISDKKKKSESFDAKIKQKTKSFSLTPGIYTAGENVYTGSFTVTGDGSFTVTSSDANLKTNTMLGDDDFQCTLEDGDIVKLETTATFVPTEA